MTRADWRKRAERVPVLAALLRAREWVLLGGWRSDESAVSHDFARVFGRPLDWGNPQTLNEKLNVLKTRFRVPEMTRLVDKWAVREVVRGKIGEKYLVPLLGVWERARDVSFAELPDAFVLKVNHGSGQNAIVRNKAKEDERALKKTLARWMKENHAVFSREWPYRGVVPRITAEELLLEGDGSLPKDYKFHCFAGRVETVQVDLDRETAHKRNFYDLDWRKQPFLWCETEADGAPKWPNGPDVPRPAALEEMTVVAETLSRGWPYVRVDLFCVAGKVYFGELTFYHGSGLERFFPPEKDLALGKLLAMPPLD